MSGVKFISFEAAGGCLLEPAPSIQDEEGIYAAMVEDKTPRLEIDPVKLVNTTVKVIADYRGKLLYTEGGLKIHRFAPSTGFINQYTGWPVPGTSETVKIGDFYAKVEFQ
jgi:hypothetical protein